MENYRSMSVKEGKMQIDSYTSSQAPKNMHELRSYSTSYVTTGQANANVDQKEAKIKKFKSKSASASAAASIGWSFNDPEMQRKKRVVSYKVYSVEGKMKGSLRKSFRWIKDTCGWF